MSNNHHQNPYYNNNSSGGSGRPPHHHHPQQQQQQQYGYVGAQGGNNYYYNPNPPPPQQHVRDFEQAYGGHYTPPAARPSPQMGHYGNVNNHPPPPQQYGGYYAPPRDNQYSSRDNNQYYQQPSSNSYSNRSYHDNYSRSSDRNDRNDRNDNRKRRDYDNRNDNRNENRNDYRPRNDRNDRSNSNNYDRSKNRKYNNNNQSSYNKAIPQGLDSNTLNIKAHDDKVPLRNNIPIWNFSHQYTDTDMKSNGDEQRKRFFETAEKEGTSNAPFASFIEYHRFKKIKELRNLYEDDVKELLFGLEAPKESLNRWLFEQLSSVNNQLVDENGTAVVEKQSTHDSLLKRPEFAIESPVLKAEIYSEIPSRLRCRGIAQASKSLDSYYMNGLDWLQKIKRFFAELDTTNDTGREICEKIGQELKELKEFLDQNSRHKFDLATLEQKQKDLTSNCTSLFKDALKERVDEVCARLVEHSKKITQELDELISTRKPLSESEWLIKLEYIENDSEPLCIVELYSEGTVVDSFKLNLVHFNKLRLLYQKHNQEIDPDLKIFPYRLYALLRRYQTFFGDSESEEGANFHAALPEKGFEFLYKEFNVCHECFASPINCYFSSFCSAFPDTDVYFGSRGSFFEFRPTQGFFECGPPYTLEVMNKTAEYCLQLLKASDEPLSFAVFVPEWTDTEYGRMLHPDSTPLCTGHLLAEQGKHEYVIGMQHFKENEKRYWTLPFPTHVYFLQNEKGKEKWPITPQLIERYKKVMEISQ
ncbi:phosphorylated CTD interacting factor [Naegleria gruberi]|uniref:Phosphorylated CTD interacting factor n=1 Tax=Naegleria gruberi TaxID=5762 RepID=D2V319_NAEGR|nr:phosphorylated CTD interacting factor [Naegleria gruberi]EFC48702.1 phosphorylated CTD interacting factor [Naegleria gruberi]|eukprot:XP_002681446.1 phosphorylated CTD interacting factor [Naegleria gruberi strain NEG-M]